MLGSSCSLLFSPAPTCSSRPWKVEHPIPLGPLDQAQNNFLTQISLPVCICVILRGPQLPNAGTPCPRNCQGHSPSPVLLSLPASSLPTPPANTDSFSEYKPKGAMVHDQLLFCLSEPSACLASPPGVTFPALCCSRAARSLAETSPAPFPLFNCSSYFQNPWGWGRGRQGLATASF